MTDGPLPSKRIAQTTLEVPALGLGCGPIGGYRKEIDAARAASALEGAWAAGIRYFDTAPWYGNTASEHRTGALLRERDRSSFVLTTKVGRVYRPAPDPAAFAKSPVGKRWPGGLPFDPQFDYTRDGILRSLEDSLQRLGVVRVDGVAIHDLDLRHRKTEEGVANGLRELDSGGGYRALSDLKSSGEIKAIGVGINHLGMISRFLERFEIDYFLVAMPYTLLDQPALDQDLPLCERHGSSVIIGAPFASGVLASGPRADGQYGYAQANQEVLDKVAAIAATCEAYGVGMRAAALQFVLAHPVVAGVVAGADTADHVAANVKALSERIPTEFWENLARRHLLRPDAPVPAGPS